MGVGQIKVAPASFTARLQGLLPACMTDFNCHHGMQVGGQAFRKNLRLQTLEHTVARTSFGADQTAITANQHPLMHGTRYVFSPRKNIFCFFFN